MVAVKHCPPRASFGPKRPLAAAQHLRYNPAVASRYLVLVAAAVAWAADHAAPRTRWAGPDVTLQGAPSPDGRWISYASAADGALALHGTAGETRRIATPPAGSREFAY